jgi:hypothetical protein
LLTVRETAVRDSKRVERRLVRKERVAVLFDTLEEEEW